MYLFSKIVCFVFTSFVLLACSREKIGDSTVPISKEDKYKSSFGHLGGEDFLSFGPGTKNKGGAYGPSMVNPYLWRASLETLNFMPLISADATGGVIVTDWYAGKNPSEQLKVTVVITDQVLRADAVKVTVHKQIRKDGIPQTSMVDGAVATELENIILSKARQLRINRPID